MTSLPATSPADTQTPSSVEQRFRELASAWDDAVAHHSSTSIRMGHPAYHEIIKLGPEVVPLLLRDMEDHHTHWFLALERITGADPIPETAAGNIPRMVEAWLSWARSRGYCW